MTRDSTRLDSLGALPADHVTFSKIFFFKKNIYTKIAIISHVLNQNLYASSFRPAEQFYLSFFCLFYLTKVLKFRSENITWKKKKFVS